MVKHEPSRGELRPAGRAERASAPRSSVWFVCVSTHCLAFRALLTQFLIRKRLWTFTGEKARVSLATGAMCSLSEQLRPHSSFLGSRLHISMPGNWGNGSHSPPFHPARGRPLREGRAGCPNWPRAHEPHAAGSSPSSAPPPQSRSQLYTGVHQEFPTGGKAPSHLLRPLPCATKLAPMRFGRRRRPPGELLGGKQPLPGSSELCPRSRDADLSPRRNGETPCSS